MTTETLNERAAKVLGWKEHEQYPGYWGLDGDYGVAWPDFEHSIDAQAPLEAIAREAGWLISSIFETGAGIIALWYCPERNLHAQGIAPTEPEARAKALLAVFEIEQGEKS